MAVGVPPGMVMTRVTHSAWRGDSSRLPVLPVVKEVEPSLQDVAAGVELREEKRVGTLMDKTWKEVVAP